MIIVKLSSSTDRLNLTSRTLNLLLDPIRIILNPRFKIIFGFVTECVFGSGNVQCVASRHEGTGSDVHFNRIMTVFLGQRRGITDTAGAACYGGQAALGSYFSRSKAGEASPS